MSRDDDMEEDLDESEDCEIDGIQMNKYLHENDEDADPDEENCDLIKRYACDLLSLPFLL